MYFTDSEFKPQDRVILAVPVLPAYRHNPEYVGVLQWCNGPAVEPIANEVPSVGFALVAAGTRTKFYFRALKHSLSLLDCTKKNGDTAILTAFTRLCNDPKIVEHLGQPFAKDLADPALAQRLVDTITEQFNTLHET